MNKIGGLFAAGSADGARLVEAKAVLVLRLLRFAFAFRFGWQVSGNFAFSGRSPSDF